MFGLSVVLSGEGVASAADLDGDGWAISDGDCCDDPSACPNPALVNPGAFELLGNGVDDDCDATTSDSTPALACSSQSLFGGVTSEDLAKAMDLCQTTAANPPLSDRKWGVLDTQFLLASGALPNATESTT